MNTNNIRLIDGREFTVTVLPPVLPDPNRFHMKKRRKRGMKGLSK